MSTAVMKKILMSIEDVASLTPFSRQAIYKMIERGQIPARKLGRRIVFDPNELETWVRELRAKPDLSETIGENGRRNAD